MTSSAHQSGSGLLRGEFAAPPQITLAQIIRTHMRGEEFTWVVVDRPLVARRLAQRLITRGLWFCYSETEGEHTFIISSRVDLEKNRAFLGLPRDAWRLA